MPGFLSCYMCECAHVCARDRVKLAFLPRNRHVVCRTYVSPGYSDKMFCFASLPPKQRFIKFQPKMFVLELPLFAERMTYH